MFEVMVPAMLALEVIMHEGLSQQLILFHLHG